MWRGRAGGNGLGREWKDLRRGHKGEGSYTKKKVTPNFKK